VESASSMNLVGKVDENARTCSPVRRRTGVSGGNA
jgi:hypothetical protein